MDMEALLIFLAVGAVAGWLAGLVVDGSGLGLFGDIVVGICGSFIAGWLLPRVGIHIGGGVITYIINAAVGGVVLLLLLSLIRRR